MPRWSLAEATAHVARADPALAAAIERIGPLSWRPRQADAFGALVRAIVFQQLAGRAAMAIHGRLAALTPDGVTPQGILALSERQMRGAGLSAAKTASIRDLATKAADGTLPLRRLSRLSDDQIVARLSEVRGIGRWTAEMLLIFQLRRPDVWPVDDLGVRRGFARTHDLPELPAPKSLAADGERYRPYRTVAALFCWRAVAVLSPGPIKPFA
jgi:DNA-3-methyladenine glycosylase II